MPYPNEHAARLREPGDFDPKSFGRTAGGTIYGSKKVPATIGIIWGKLKGKAGKDDPPIGQSLRFPTKNWTAAKAKAWLKDNKIKHIRFEPASAKKQQHREVEDERYRQVPAAACCFSTGEFELGDNGEEARSAPIKVVARSGQPCEHWFWGRTVHDLAGMDLHKSRLPVDYCHERDQIIGYLNRFDVGSGDLVCEGALTPWGENDRAAEIIQKAKAGVPWEASIYFGGGGLEIEELPAGKSAEVNGYSLDGPATIFRRWPLRGVAVCPYGADMNTSSQFAADSEIRVKIQSTGESTMSDETLTVETESAPAEADQVVETEAGAAEQMSGEKPAEAAQQAVDADKEKAAESGEQQGQSDVEAGATKERTPQEQCAEFIKAFGDKGGTWFAEGKSFAEAQQLYLADLRQQLETAQDENETLRAKLTVGRGETDPVEFQPADDSPEAKRLAELERNLGPKLALMAANMKIRDRGEGTR